MFSSYPAGTGTPTAMRAPSRQPSPPSDEIIYQALGLDGEGGQGDLIIVLRD
jgi:hypothetical protein